MRRAWDDARFRRLRYARRCERIGWCIVAAALVTLVWLGAVIFSAPLP